jgi:hypothetical protein
MTSVQIVSNLSSFCNLTISPGGASGSVDSNVQANGKVETGT